MADIVAALGGNEMSTLTGAELGGGLPPPVLRAPQLRTDSETATHGGNVPFSSDAAILQLTDDAARAIVQGSQELVDRRTEKNAADKDEAREAAAKEARQRSLEEQGLAQPDRSADEDLVNAEQQVGQGDEVPADSAQPSATPDPSAAVDVLVQAETGKFSGDQPEQADPAVKADQGSEAARLDVVA